MSLNQSEPSNSSRPSSIGGAGAAAKAADFHYNKELLAQLQIYIKERNHHGLALFARQKGIPPFLRFKVWAILLKHHPFVVSPFIQPDNMEKESPAADQDSEDAHLHLKHKIRKDLRRYMHGIAYLSSEEPLSKTELQLFDILENSVFKFVLKWGKIIKYDSALTWIALGLAEWFPPIPHTPWVLLGRAVSSEEHSCVGSVLLEYSQYIEIIPELDLDIHLLLADESTSSLTYPEAYERLALVLMHSPEGANKRTHNGSSTKIDKSTLPLVGGTIEERVSFFIYVFQKLLPELSDHFQEEQILNKFGLHDDEWVLWWLKYCGSKVWSRVDRGRIWDLMLGWRPKSKKAELDSNYYVHKLNTSDEIIEALGPDAFWSVDYEEDVPRDLTRNDSFKDLMSGLHIDNADKRSSTYSTPSLTTSNSLLTPNSEVCPELPRAAIPFCKLDPHMELLFVSLSLIKAKENTLLELDQHEIRTYLSRLPAKSSKLSDKYKQYQEQKDKEKGFVNNDHGLMYDYMDKIIHEAGELWRKWLWSELNDDL